MAARAEIAFDKYRKTLPIRKLRSGFIILEILKTKSSPPPAAPLHNFILH